MTYRVERQLQQMGQEDSGTLPEMIRVRMDQTYAKLGEQPLPQQQKKKSRGVAWVSASTAAAAILLLGSGFLFPVMAEAFKNIPIVGSMFQTVGDTGLRKAAELGKTNDVNQSVTHDGVTFTISELVFDNNRLSMLLTRTTESGEQQSLKKWLSHDKDHETRVSYFVDGKPLDAEWSLQHGFEGADNTGVLSLDPMKIPKQDQFELTVEIWDAVLGQQFSLAFPVQKSDMETNLVQVPQAKTFDHMTMSIEQFAITSSTMRLDISITGESGQLLNLESIDEKYKYKEIDEFNLYYEIVNEKGEKAIEIEGGGGFNDETGIYLNSMSFQPFAVLPSSITVKPYIHVGKNKTYIPELEFVLPVEQ
ncbi:DUF4179 domain-containing protein [Paenibacillus sp. NEAU-GSW1]|uniref:DUF4179 domain-containing protein n=1 Tax=Paenibacillus sp. NEAU-GSW1 TaxID=2682486 RepID=UPI0015661E2E|nr:DUF4179 domain-containing protein [Paenibacillus sp. NEAU-GSW1]